MMSRNTIVILGIPVDNLTMDEAIVEIFNMVEDYKVDGRPRQVATVNVDFVVNTLAWRLKNIRHPELLDILRRADLVTADGMPILWISKLLGVPLKERVTGADLVPKLAEEAARREKSIYFLGGRGDVGQQAANVLKFRHPGLRIAGVYSPFVHVDGEAIAEAEDEDAAIVEDINRSGADVLLIGFGNPKQEVWFDRNRSKLRVPVSIGIGGTYEFIVGSVSRAPEWMQRVGLEWLFRITQDPKRLIKRYIVGFLKFGAMVWPAILYYRYRRFLQRVADRRSAFSENLGASVKESASSHLKVIRFPMRLDAFFLEGHRDKVMAEMKQAPIIVLDFGGTSFIDSSGLGFVTKLRVQAERGKKAFYVLGIRASVANLFKISRIWDLFKGISYPALNDLLPVLKQKRSIPSFYFVSQPHKGYSLISLFGRLDAAQMQHLDLDSIGHDIGDSDCIMDLGGLDFVDSSGLAFFIKIQRQFMKKARSCILCQASHNVMQMFRIAKVMPLFLFASDISGAIRKLESEPAKVK